MALTNKYKSISDINLDIDNILKNYYNKFLAVTFNTYDLERIIEELSYVKYARVSYTINERKPSTAYQLGYMIEEDGSYYKVSKILGYTAEAEPDDGWNVPATPGASIDTLAVTRDGSVYWKCYKRLSGISNISKRQPSGQYGIGDFMYMDTYPNYMFKCIDIAKNSGGTRPSTLTSNLGDFIVDGGIVWVVTDKRSEAPSWNSFAQYRLGDVVNTDGDYSLECISYTGSTGSVEDLSFVKNEYTIDDINDARDTFIIKGDQTYYFKSGDIIQAQYTGGYTTFVVVESIYRRELDTTSIKVKRYQDGIGEVIDSTKDYKHLVGVERGTKDGGILWEAVDNPEKVTYAWNSFVTFAHTLEIVE
jgi:hypothetical protein